MTNIVRIKPSDIVNEVESVLQQNRGKYLTAYQIYEELSNRTKRRLTQEVTVRSGKLTTHPYSKASTIADACEILTNKNRIIIHWLDTRGILFCSKTDKIHYEPGHAEKTGIYSIL